MSVSTEAIKPLIGAVVRVDKRHLLEGKTIAAVGASATWSSGTTRG